MIDEELDELLPSLAALTLEGAKGVGKTATASRRASTIYRLDDPAQRGIARAEPPRLVEGKPPILIDEWQHVPEAWDLVRRAVDDGAPPGHFLLTGSSSPGECRDALGCRAHRPPVEGATDVRLERYVDEIVSSGFPGFRGLAGRPLRAQLDGYVSRIVERDFEAQGHIVRNPSLLYRWLTAYAAATSTTASFETIRAAATSGEGEKPAKTTTLPYRDVLERLWIVDPVPAWLPTRRRISRLAAPRKHQLADPAIAARLLGVDAGALLDAVPVGPPIPHDGPLLGAHFEALVTLDVRVYAQASEASVKASPHPRR